MQQPMPTNQELARLRHADILRNASRRHVVETPVETVVHEGLWSRFVVALRASVHVPTLHPSAR